MSHNKAREAIGYGGRLDDFMGLFHGLRGLRKE